MPVLGMLSLLLGCLVQPQCDSFHFLLFCFAMFGCFLLEACLFFLLMRHRKGVGLDERGSREELGRVEGEETLRHIE